ncbi:MAG TPA: hypothetical protein VGA13_00395 [Acidimicrobiales bacterium]
MGAIVANLTSLAAIGWEPEIRGALVVLIAVAVLCGSIYLVLATNAGARLGFTLAFTGLMGWMLVMGVIWAMYGIGLKGDSPTWEVREVVVGNIEAAEVAKVRELVDQDAAVAGDWKALPEGDGDRGEAAAAVDDFFTAGDRSNRATYFGDTAASFLTLAVFDVGGKDELDDKRACSFHRPDTYGGCWDRMTNKIAQTTQLKHPTHYAVVQLQAEELDVNGDPTGELDSSGAVVNVVLIRDLGNLRLPALAVTVASGILFAVGVSQLHRRDLEAMDAVATAA